MTSSQPDGQQDEQALEFVDRYLAFLDGNGTEPDALALEERSRAQAFLLLRAFDMFDPEPPAPRPLDEDPIARRFGFGRTDPTVTLSTAAIKEVASAHGMKMGELAQRLTDAGDPTTLGDLLGLLGGVTVTVDRARGARLIAILDSSLLDLEVPGTHHPDGLSLDAFLVLEAARQIIDSFAAEHRMGSAEVTARAHDELALTVFRNKTESSWMEALRAVLERIAREHP